MLPFLEIITEPYKIRINNKIIMMIAPTERYTLLFKPSAFCLMSLSSFFNSLLSVADKLLLSICCISVTRLIMLVNIRASTVLSVSSLLPFAAVELNGTAKAIHKKRDAILKKFLIFIFFKVLKVKEVNKHLFRLIKLKHNR